VLSQFWPDAPPQRHTFLMRNATMSGYGLATVVVEAGETSGARAQARIAVEHGRQVILTDRVVGANEWAQKLVGRPGVHVAGSVAAVLDVVEQVEAMWGELRRLVTPQHDRSGARTASRSHAHRHWRRLPAQPRADQTCHLL
jgi:DNA processing protein